MDNLEIIQQGLQQYGGKQKSQGRWHMICCPYHDDKEPSAGVLVEPSEPKYLGRFSCFGCGTKVTWNEFAERTGLEKIDEANNTPILVANDKDLQKLLDGELTLRKILTLMRCQEAQPWPKVLEWRGYSGRLISKVGGLIINDDYNDSIAALFPIMIGGKYRGAVKAIYERTARNKSAYFTMEGEWVNKYGLFPYQYAKRLADTKKLRFVFVVEGPRDALRLLSRGIPAVAVLGASAMSTKKALFVSAIAQDVYVLSDNDSGGDTLFDVCKKYLKPQVASFKRIKLPKPKKNGKLIKMDPGNMPEHILDEIVDFLINKYKR